MQTRNKPNLSMIKISKMEQKIKVKLMNCTSEISSSLECCTKLFE